MKKFIFSLSAFLVCFGVNAQKVIETPKHGFATISTLKIARVELNKTATIIHFDVSYRPKNWISIPSKTYIQAVNSDKKLYIEKAEGINIDEKFYMPESGKTSYVLYFPPIDETVAAIDYGEGNDGGQWFIYDIELVTKKWISVLPESYKGNWLRTDGSNTWDYGLYENAAIYKSAVWQYEKIEPAGRLNKIILKKEQESKTIYVKPGKKGKVWFGEDPKNMILYSQEFTDNPKYRIENDQDFQLPVFKNDSAVYKGFISGYSPRIKSKTGLIYVNDILSQNQESYLLKINEGGTFEVKLPLYYPHEVYIRGPVFNGNVYLEPGKTTFHLLNPGEKPGGSLFMGDLAKVNSDLAVTNNIFSFDYTGTMDKVLDMSAQEYKKLILECRQKDLDKFNAWKSTHQVSKKALKIRELGIDYRNYTYLFSYNMMRQSAYRTKNKIPPNQPAGSFTPVIMDDSYFDVIRDLGFDDPLAVVSDDFSSYINRLKFNESFTGQSRTTYLDVLDHLEKSGIEVSPEVKAAAKASQDVQNAPDRDKAMAEYREKYKSILDNFNEKNKEAISEIGNSWYLEMRYRRLKDAFGLDQGLALDIIKSQDICQILKSNFTPLTEDKLASMKDQFSTPFIPEYIRMKNNEIIAQIEANKRKTDYRVYDTPKTEADKIFDAIMEKFRGKVVYVDFWATWCGPCLSGIKTIAPLKEEMTGKDVVFVYITNPTSPETTYKNMIPDIKGEHFRLNQDEWNYISGKFRISGIPHYALVNKRGEVVNPDLAHMSNAALKELLMRYLEE